MPVVSKNRIEDNWVFIATFADFLAKCDVAALIFMCERLADVMQQPSTFSELDIAAKLGGNESSKMRDFEAMPKRILSIARAIFELANQPFDVVMHCAEPEFEDNIIAFFKHSVFIFLFHTFIDFLDSCGLNPAIFNKSLDHTRGNRTAIEIEAAEHNRIGCVINDDIDTEYHFK